MKSIEFITEKIAAGPSTGYIKKVAAMLRKDCAPFLQANRDSLSQGQFLYRGMEGISTFAKRYVVRYGRTPRDTSMAWHTLMDQFLTNQFGWQYRSAAVFATTNISEALSFGHLFLIFPIGEYSICYSPAVVDFTLNLAGGSAGSPDPLSKEVIAAIDEIPRQAWKVASQKYNLPELHDSNSFILSLANFNHRSFEISNIAVYKKCLLEFILPYLKYQETKHYADTRGCEAMIKCTGYYAIRYDTDTADELIDYLARNGLH